ncbi:MAG: hypothetical protein RL387_722 [Bacteroidota bacterium]|jgi:hypothetical protein
MKHLLKYIFLLITICVIVTPVEAKKKQKKSQKSTTIKKKSTKKNKNNKILVKKDASTKKLNLNDLLNETTVTIAPTKSDSIPEKVVTILSAFKPQLKNVAKIGFVNATAAVDSTSILLNYQVPSQNLSFEYRPIALVPRAIVHDSLVSLTNITNFKIGFGNYSHQYAQLGINTLDKWKNTHSITLFNEASTGTDHRLQIIREIGAKYIGDQYVNKYNNIQTQLFYNHSQRYRFGLVPNSSNLPESNYEHNFEHMGASFALLNTKVKQRFFNIHPMAKFEHFQGIIDATNTWYEVNNPMYLQFKNKIKFNLDLSYSFNQYNPTGVIHQKNTILRADPAISIEKWGTTIKAGASPVWVNKDDYQFYPNVHLQKKLTDTNYLVKTGWTTIFDNTQYTSLAIQNPWVMPVADMKITSNERKYITVEVSAGKRLDYSIGVSINEYKNLPFFNRILGTDVNTYGLKYQAIFEKRAATLELDAKLKYQFSDKLLFVNTMNYKQFNIIKDNAKPWGILPLELNSIFNWLPNKKWVIEASAQYWTGAAQFDDGNKSYNLKNVVVLNAGFTFKLSSSWSIWAKGENLLDKPYERWAYYPSLGAQITGGIIYSYRK